MGPFYWCFAKSTFLALWWKWSLVLYWSSKPLWHPKLDLVRFVFIASNVTHSLMLLRLIKTMVSILEVTMSATLKALHPIIAMTLSLQKVTYCLWVMVKPKRLQPIIQLLAKMKMKISFALQSQLKNWMMRRALSNRHKISCVEFSSFAEYTYINLLFLSIKSNVSFE